MGINVFDFHDFCFGGEPDNYGQKWSRRSTKSQKQRRNTVAPPMRPSAQGGHDPNGGRNPNGARRPSRPVAGSSSRNPPPHMPAGRNSRDQSLDMPPPGRDPRHPTSRRAAPLEEDLYGEEGQEGDAPEFMSALGGNNGRGRSRSIQVGGPPPQARLADRQRQPSRSRAPQQQPQRGSRRPSAAIPQSHTRQQSRRPHLDDRTSGQRARYASGYVRS